MANTLAVICQGLRSPQALVALARPPDQFEIVALHDGSWAPLTVGQITGSPSSALFLETVTSPTSLTLADLADTPYGADNLLVEAGARSYLGVPLVDINGAAVGVLAVLDREVHHYTTHDQDLLGCLKVCVEQDMMAGDGTPAPAESVEFYRALAEEAEECISVLDLEAGRFIFRNRSAREAMQNLLGVTGAEMYTGMVEEFSPEFQENGQLSGEMVNQLIERAVAGESLRFEWLHQHIETGAITPTELSLARFSPTQPWLLRLGLVDITERKQAEARVRESEENLRTTLASIGDAVLATDLDGRVTRMNPVAERLTGWSQAEAVGRPLSQVFRTVEAETRAPSADVFQQVMAGGDVEGPANGSILISRDGTEHVIADSGAPLRDGHGDLLGIVVVFHDMTREHQLQQMVQLSEKMSALGELAAGIAHDFNNVLATILGAAELIRYEIEAPSDGLTSSIELVTTAVSRGRDLTNRMLSLGRKGEYEVANVDVHEAVRSVMAIFESTLDKRIRLSAEVSGAPAIIRCDASAFHNALLNLGINSGQAMPEGGRLTVSVRRAEPDHDRDPDESGGWAEIAVTDTGEGIPPEHLRRIFEPFFTTKGPNGGAGLGLATVYNMVEQFGGNIDVASEVEVGTTVTMSFPTVAGALIAPQAVADDLDLPAELRITVLFVDDEEPMRDAYATVLREWGCEVVTASNGIQALEVFEAERDVIDLILLDMAMPRMSGDEVAQRVRDMGDTTPIVICSGYLTDDQRQRMTALGITDLLPKPYTLNDLRRLVVDRVSGETDRARPVRPG